MEKQFLNYINWFRGLAIVFVVFGHTIPLYEWGNIIQKNITHSFFGGATILFLFISDYLFEHLKNRFEIKKYYFSKFKYVIIPYLIVSILAILIYILGFKNDHKWILTIEFNSLSTYLKIIKFYLTGAHLGPLWYIPMTILMFAIPPILLLTMKNNILKFLVVLVS